MKFLNPIFIVLVLFFNLQLVSAQTCLSLFVDSSIVRHARLDTQYQLTTDHIAAAPSLKLVPLKAVRSVGEKLSQLISKSDLNFISKDIRFAINLSKNDQLHIVTDNMTNAQHLQLIDFLQSKNIENLLSNIPILFRNKYFEVSASLDAHGIRKIQVEEKFARDLSFPIQSQLLTGFATVQTNKVRPYDSNTLSPNEKIRKNLTKLTLIQDTFATCGLASTIKIFMPRKIKTTETELLELVETVGIRSLSEVFGSDPGLTLSQLAKLLKILGLKHGFTVQEVPVTGDRDVAEFAKVAEWAASEGKNIDVIVNYASPALGRPGGGHFTPLAGYNSISKEVLLGEVNLAMNPPFWTHQEDMVKAMVAQNPGELPRGYLIIRWN